MRNELIAIAPSSWVLAALLGCGDGSQDPQAGLKNADPGLRRAAIRQLASADDGIQTVAMPSLLPLLHDDDDSVRIAAALLVYQIDPDSGKAHTALSNALQTGHGPVFIAIGRSGEQGGWAVPTLTELLTDRRVSIRALAAKTLGDVGATDEASQTALRYCLRDSNSTVRDAARAALGSPKGT